MTFSIKGMLFVLYLFSFSNFLNLPFFILNSIKKQKISNNDNYEYLHIYDKVNDTERLSYWNLFIYFKSP